jgi:cytochrome c oxidase subunit 2
VLGVTCVVLAAGVGALIGLVSGRAGMPEPAAAEGRPVLDAWRMLLTAALALAAVVVALLAVALVGGVRRQRRAERAVAQAGPAHAPAEGAEAAPSADTRLELVYTAIPLVVAAAVFTLGLWTTARQELDRPAELTVQVTGFQWGWRYTYPDGPTVVGTAEAPPELVLPLGRDVRLELVANDVQHSLFVPAYLIKRDLIPGRTNSLVVRAEKAGVFRGHCAEFCGLDHARMNFTVRVVPGEEFDGWLAGTAGAT